MLGKLLKKEVFEKKRIVSIYLMTLFIVAGLYALTSIIRDAADSTIFDMTAAFSLLLFILMAIGSVIVIFGVSVGDYNKTCFKDQGYLTNTLPVTSGQIVLSKMIIDSLITIVIVALLPLSVAIAMRDLDVYSNCTIFLIRNMLEDSNTHVSVAQQVIAGIAILIMIVFACISNIWMFNTAITFGNCSNGNRKIVGVAAYFVIYAVLQVISIAIMGIGMCFEIPNWYEELSSFNQFIILVGVLDVYFIAITIAFGIVSSKVIAKKINIE